MDVHGKVSVDKNGAKTIKWSNGHGYRKIEKK